MPATKISDLLPIAPGTRQPHPYQVLGLEDGEQDPKVITRAIKRSIASLKAAKPQADDKVWKRAALLVKQAQEVLTSPEQKAELDARFGIVSTEAIPDSPGAAPDPLIGVLPPGDPLQSKPTDPLAAVLPSSNPLAPASFDTELPRPSSDWSHVEPATAETSERAPSIGELKSSDAASAEIDGGRAAQDSTVEINSPAPVSVQPAKKKKKRKRSSTGMFLLATFAVVCLAIVGGLVFFLLYGPGELAITKGDGGISISTQPRPNDDGVASAPPAAPPPRPTPKDPIMGSLGKDRSPSLLKKPSGIASSLPEDSDNLRSPTVPMTPEVDSTPEMMQPPPSIASDPAAELSVDEMPTMQSDAGIEMQAEMEPPDEATIAAADQALDRVRQLIRTADWKAMKPAAEAVLEQRMTPTQQRDAEALQELADLAVYYRGGIERAVADLKVGDDFEVVDDFRVIVVETGPDLLVVRFNAKNRSFTLDELPWSLAHKLATFSMPQSPSSQAAKAAYQSIAPKSNNADRQQALEWLDGIQGEVEGANPQRLSETIRSLFPEP